MNTVKNVHIIYKTHLDVGFTDLAANVVDNYVNHFIPKAIDLAHAVNTEEQRKFVWSTDSWMVDHYLKTVTGETYEKAVEAINKGYIAWHAMPITPHCEVMDEDLFRFGLTISEKLDKQFGKTTKAAKLTDVPGHTAGIIKYLAEADIGYLHIGINDASALPDVPATFVWRSPEGKEIIVDYCMGYGGEKPLDFGTDLLYFAHTGDNLGPPSIEEIEEVVKQLEEKYPEAKVFGSTLHDYSRAILPYKSEYPVIEAEIADTWIHGAGTDPFKVGVYKEYLKEMAQIKDQVSDEEKEAFYYAMLMVAEHTWGVDVKKYLADYVNWDKKSFQTAREKDVLLPEYAGKYQSVYDFAKNEFGKQIKKLKWEDRTYAHFESAHAEQRAYLDQAIESFNPQLKARFEAIRDAYSKLRIKDETASFNQVETPHLKLTSEGISESSASDANLKINEDGTVVWEGHTLGRFSYTLYGTDIFEAYRENYSYEIFGKNYEWAMPDFYKIGFEDCGATPENRSFSPDFQKAWIKDNALIVQVTYDEAFCADNGCPREIFIKYVFNGKQAKIEANALNKEAHRMPESLWLSFFEPNAFENVTLKKLNTMIDPYNVVHRGNRNYHGVEQVIFDGGNVQINPLHTPLVSLGEQRLYDFNQSYADHKEGVHFNIYNNLWGTNFKMWCEEDIKAEYELTIDI